MGLELGWKKCAVSGQKDHLHSLPEAVGATRASHAGEILAFSFGQEEQQSD